MHRGTTIWPVAQIGGRSTNLRKRGGKWKGNHPFYLPAWRREREIIRRSRLSSQYQKAWNASFPPELWPAEEAKWGRRDLSQAKRRHTASRLRTDPGRARPRPRNGWPVLVGVPKTYCRGWLQAILPQGKLRAKSLCQKELFSIR
jgi:hypothetical protein